MNDTPADDDLFWDLRGEGVCRTQQTFLQIGEDMSEILTLVGIAAIVWAIWSLHYYGPWH